MKKKLVADQQGAAKQADAAFLAENAKKRRRRRPAERRAVQGHQGGRRQEAHSEGHRDHPVPGQPGRWKGDCHRLSRRPCENLSAEKALPGLQESVADDERGLGLADRPAAGPRLWASGVRPWKMPAFLFINWSWYPFSPGIDNGN